jgi:hypothetical protein
VGSDLLFRQGEERCGVGVGQGINFLCGAERREGIRQGRSIGASHHENPLFYVRQSAYFFGAAGQSRGTLHTPAIQGGEKAALFCI